MSARRRPRLPPAIVRAGVRQLGRRCLDPGLPWAVQRTRLDQLTRALPPPRGTALTEQDVGGVRAEVVSSRDTDPRVTVVHFHGGGSALAQTAWFIATVTKQAAR